MLATALEPVLNNERPESQNEITLTDLEISRRVSEIRSSWTADERIERRKSAGERFEKLIGALCLAEAA